MTTLTQKNRLGEYVLCEADCTLSREAIAVLAGDALESGQVLGQITVGASATVAAMANTGNGTIGTVTLAAGAQAGAYFAYAIEPAANGGKFVVEDPAGKTIGIATVAVAFSAGGLTFTIADGSTDFVSGDSFTITVAAGSGKYAPYDPAGTDGRQKAVAILYAGLDTSASDRPAVITARQAEVDANRLVSLDAAARVSLATKAIIVR